jgi:hypothetical protein
MNLIGPNIPSAFTHSSQLRIGLDGDNFSRGVSVRDRVRFKTRINIESALQYRPKQNQESSGKFTKTVSMIVFMMKRTRFRKSRHSFCMDFLRRKHWVFIKMMSSFVRVSSLVLCKAVPYSGQSRNKLYSCFVFVKNSSLIGRQNNNKNENQFCRAHRITYLRQNWTSVLFLEKHKNKTVTKIVRTPDSVSKSTDHHAFEYPSLSKSSTIGCSIRELSSSHKLYQEQSCILLRRCWMWILIWFCQQLVGTYMTNPTKHKTKQSRSTVLFLFLFCWTVRNSLSIGLIGAYVSIFDIERGNRHLCSCRCKILLSTWRTSSLDQSHIIWGFVASNFHQWGGMTDFEFAECGRILNKLLWRGMFMI